MSVAVTDLPLEEDQRAGSWNDVLAKFGQEVIYHVYINSSWIYWGAVFTRIGYELGIDLAGPVDVGQEFHNDGLCWRDDILASAAVSKCSAFDKV